MYNLFKEFKFTQDFSNNILIEFIRFKSQDWIFRIMNLKI